MGLEVGATYQHGILKPDAPLPLQENQRVTVTVHEHLSRARRSYGLMEWKDDPKIIEQVALDPEFGSAESP